MTLEVSGGSSCSGPRLDRDPYFADPLGELDVSAPAGGPGRLTGYPSRNEELQECRMLLAPTRWRRRCLTNP